MRAIAPLFFCFALLYPAVAPAENIWDRIRGCNGSDPVKNETDLKALAQYKIMRDRIAAENRAHPRSRVVLTGDSLAAYFQPVWLARYLPGLEIANRGIPGDTTLRLLGRLEGDVLALEPEVIILSIGGNDLLNNRCPGKTIEYTELIFQLIHAKRPGTRIIVVSIPPTSVDRANQIVPDYNAELRSAARDAGVVFLDLWPALVAPDGDKIDPRYQADSIHINEAGYRRWAELMLTLLK